jgi:formylglycine-generating enzyme required for sulfatase activity
MTLDVGAHVRGRSRSCRGSPRPSTVRSTPEGSPEMKRSLSRAIGSLSLSPPAAGAEAVLQREGAPPKEYRFSLDGQTKTMEAGRYAITVTRPGCDPVQGRIEVTEAYTTSYVANLAEREALFSVTSDPPGAEVVLDGDTIGHAPYTGGRVKPGKHIITCRLPGYAPEQRIVRLAATGADQNVAVKLQRMPTLRLSGLGPDVSATMGGNQVVGEFTVEPGPVTVALTHRGVYAPQVWTQEVELGRTYDVTPPKPWDQCQARLDLKAVPADAIARIGDGPPLEKVVEFAEEGEVVVLLSRPGYPTVQRRARLEFGKLVTLVVEPPRWSPEAGTLDLSLFDPSWRCEIEGRRVGPMEPLEPKMYELVVIREGFDVVKIPVPIQAGRTIQVPRPTFVPSKRDAPVVETPPPPVRPVTDVKRLLTDLAAWDAATGVERRLAVDQVDARLPDFELRQLEWFECGGARHEIAVFLHGRTGLEFVLIPGGRFVMGSPPDEPGRSEHERQHWVTLTKPFLMCRTEVPQAVYVKADMRNPSEFKRNPRRPVERVSWSDAQSYCAKIDCALPTEAQWEYACRAGTTTAFTTGPNVGSLNGYANVADRYMTAHKSDKEDDREGFNRKEVDRAVMNGHCTVEFDDHRVVTEVVQKYGSNAFGLFDVHGNVWEWCSDHYGDYPDHDVDDPVGGDEPEPVARGGSWYDSVQATARCAARQKFVPATKAHVGVRPVKVVSAE